jgi:hypothetical protein
MISTAQTRYTNEALEASTRFTNPVSSVGCSSLFLLMWLCGWAVGEVLVIGMLGNSLVQSLGGGENFFAGQNIFLLFWLLFWTLGGGFALYTVAMQLAGREVIEVGHESIKIAKKAFGLGFGKTYNAINIDNLRVDESLPQFANALAQLPPVVARFGQGAVTAGGALVFEYGGTSVHFGIGLSLDEARSLLEDIVRRYPQFRMPAGSYS